MLIIHARRTQMHAISNISPPPNASVFNAEKHISQLYTFRYSFVFEDAQMDHYLRKNT